MARPKEFDREQALTTAMDVFWTHGYEATTMTALRHAMGLGRQSLYDTFGDKEALFQEALALYVSLNDADVAQRLGVKRGLAGIRAFFEHRVDMLSTGERRGCLMMNSCVELASTEPLVATQLQNGLETMQTAFERALREAVDDGELSADVDAASLALFLTAQVSALVVFSKKGATRAQLGAIADQALTTLD